MPKKAKATTICLFEADLSPIHGLNSHSKASKIDDQGVRKAKTPTTKKKRQIGLLKMNSVFEVGKVTIDLPLKTKSEANCFEPWRLRHARHKEQQRVVAFALGPMRDKISLPCQIQLTRFAPHELDVFDNLPMSLKYIVDAVCAIITGDYRAGRADGDKRITIACDQVKSKEYGVRIEIMFE